MHFITLFAVLVTLAGTSAVPHKRACGAKGASPPAGQSLQAGAAYGQGHHGGRHSKPAGGQTTTIIDSTPTSSAAPIVNTATLNQGGGQDQAASEGEDDDAMAGSSPTSSARDVTTSKAAAAAATSSAVAGAGGSSGGSAGETSGGGSGLAINTQSNADFSGFLEGKLAWYTNWADTPLSGTTGLEWVPQAFNKDAANGIAAAAKSWTGVTSVLSFNEPDMTAAVGGTDIDAATAATAHIAWVEALGGSYKIGAPAVARGSKQWLSDWVAACGGKCQYDFVPFHFYGTNANDLIEYAKDFHTTFNKPLWITEWSCKDYSTGYTCTEAEVKTFMSTAITWFRGEGASIVQRWAYFGAFKSMASAEGNPNGLENADGSINEMGKYYISL